MLGGCGLDGVRMCYVPRAEGPLSDHALLLGDVGELHSGLVDSDGEYQHRGFEGLEASHCNRYTMEAVFQEE